MERLKEEIRARARELGFALCGFAAAQPAADFRRFAEWIRAGNQAGMGYLATERSVALRADPARLLPGARTVIALAIPYPRPAEPPAAPAGIVAAYALGDDYHEVIRARLRSLCGFLDRLAGRRLVSRGFTDTAPILERGLAARAGLGWIGRNSMLIHPGLGSFFFLAEILTDWELPPDPPFAADRCGTCDRCLAACPTGCILPDRTIDARRCISYWTIEHRGPIPESIRSRIGRAVFGCDACQAACPWNRKPAPAADPAFLPRPHFPVRDPARELNLSAGEWTERFRHSALRRTGRAGYRRNLILALGNAGGEEEVPALETVRRGTDPVLREAAEWSVRQIQGKKAKNKGLDL
jgi:epoxyqueuosine reductase